MWMKLAVVILNLYDPAFYAAGAAVRYMYSGSNALLCNSGMASSPGSGRGDRCQPIRSAGRPKEARIALLDVQCVGLVGYSGICKAERKARLHDSTSLGRQETKRVVVMAEETLSI